MRRTFLTADWHLGETRFEIMQRDFKSAEEHVDTLVANHNAIVSKDDDVIMVGDVCFDPAWLEHVSRFNGTKVLIRGNHDRKIPLADLEKHFTMVVPEGEGMEMDYEGIPLFVTHYPSRAVKDRFNLVGHIHAVWKVQLNMLNVGVDVHCFRPMPIERVPFFYNAICKFYDEDVWAAYNDTNVEWRGKRGRAGSYLTEVPVPKAA